jgi:hypothetical protein
VMIVSVTRDDLRDEFNMANEAFALSPISARATQPSEEDYDAISEAFMETSRGRWFLGEYAKRNRNADTSMVLDAVARIEQSLAAQKQPAPETGLAEALAAIKTALDQARATASAAFDSLALEEHLAPVRKGARIIKEISWRWREIGADGRICDLIDSQVSAIEASCGQISSTEPRTALSDAFDLIEGRITEFDDGDAAPRRAAEEAVATPSSTHTSEMPSAVETAPAATVTSDAEVEAAMSTQAMLAEADVATAEVAEVITEASDGMAEAPDDVTTEAAEATTEAAEVAEMTAEAADAHDDAVLEMIALEMAAPDPDDADVDASVNTDADSAEMHIAERPSAEPETITAMPEAPATPVMAPAIQPSLPSLPEPSREPSPAPSRELEPSLGLTLVASGIVRKPRPSMSDPLAPIRRMSQAEKIALFS